ncbi:MAG: desulfoferrodoxin [Clostridia bacterium]|nr:desulfoferrodoxin [Clostridia bacterium]
MKEKNTVFYKCVICGNVIGLIDGDINHMTCCGKKMGRLDANSVDAAQEKHVPVYEKAEDEIVVKVGEIEHPMEKDHYIMWIAQVSDNQTTRIRLYPEQATTVRFKYIPGSTLYAYCNKHGLWKADVE